MRREELSQNQFFLLCSSGDFVRVIWVFSMGKPDCGFSWAAWFKNWSISSAFMGESKRKEVTI